MFSNIRLPLISIHSICKRYAGHSKWQNIRHTKAQKDAERSQMFIKLGQRIKTAIFENGNDDPSSNVKLAQAIEAAKSKHMPTTTVQSYISQAKKDSSKSKVYWFDLKGPKGSFFIVQTITTNLQRTKDLIRNATKRHSLAIETNLKTQFTHKGIIITKPKGTGDNIVEIGVEDAIECGAEDVELIPEDNNLKFICHPNHIKGVADKLKSIGYEVEDADEHYIPNITIQLADEDIENLSKAIDKIWSIPDVVKVYDNIE